MGRKVLIIAEGSMYEVNAERGSIVPYASDKMERDIELGYTLTVRPATKGELDYVERLNYYRRPISVSDYNFELDGVL